jgi:hypothetical protein
MFFFFKTQELNTLATSEFRYCVYWLEICPNNEMASQVLATYYTDSKAPIPEEFIPQMLHKIDVYTGGGFYDFAFKLIDKLQRSRLSSSQRSLLLVKTIYAYYKSGQPIKYKVILQKAFNQAGYAKF